jgi:hypothetical protein
MGPRKILHRAPKKPSLKLSIFIVVQFMFIGKGKPKCTLDFPDKTSTFLFSSNKV